MTQSILVVEDHHLTRQEMVVRLQKAFGSRAEIQGVSSLREAKQVVERCEISVLVTDIRLDSSDSSDGSDEGFELIRFVKRLRPRTFVLVTTAYPTLEKIPHWMRAGAFDVLEKPVSVERLNDVVKRGLDLTLTGLDRDALTERLILEEWEVVKEVKLAHARGVSLENLCSLLFGTIPGWTKIESRLSLPSEEFDLVIDNEAEEEFWRRYGSIILVECKNWHRKRKPGRGEFDTFCAKLRRRAPADCRLGFFVSINGFANTFLDEVHGILRDPQVVVPLDSSAIWDLIVASDRGMVLKQRVKNAVLGLE